MPEQPTSTPRRNFIGRLTLGAAALLAGKASDAHAEGLLRTDSPDEWVNRIHGKYRQVFDAVSANDGLGAAYALNFIESTMDALKVPASEVTAVLSLRHFGVALAANDAAWSRYRVGELLKLDDPDTKAPALRNIYRTKIRGRAGLTYDDMIAKRDVIVTVCNMALGGFAEMAAGKLKLDSAAVERDIKSSLIPGVYIVPSGVYAVNRAQQAGCTYCYAG